MSDLSEYFLSSPANVAYLETLEISHSAFSKTYWIVRNDTQGLTATLEDEYTEIEFEYYPVRIKPSGESDDLDRALSLTFGDLGDVLSTEFNNVKAANAFEEKPQVTYRAYRSDDLTKPLTVVQLEASNFAFSREGSTFDARAPYLNVKKTGEVYSFNRFPMLRGFIG